MTTARTKADKEQAQIQLAVSDSQARISKPEEVTADTVEFKGEKFRVADKIGALPLMQLGAMGDLDTSDPQGLGAVYFVLEDAIHEDDWIAWKRHARKQKATGDEIFEFMLKAMEVISGRPTKPRDGA